MESSMSRDMAHRFDLPIPILVSVQSGDPNGLADVNSLDDVRLW